VKHTVGATKFVSTNRSVQVGSQEKVKVRLLQGRSDLFWSELEIW